MNIIQGLEDDAPLKYSREVRAAREAHQQRYEYGFHPAMVLGAILDPGLRDKIKEIPHKERLEAEYLCSILASDVLTPQPNDTTRPWKPDAKGAAARAQLYKWLTGDLRGLGMEDGMFNPETTKDVPEWWVQYGTEAQLLLLVALRVIIPGTSAGNERVYSSLANFWSDKRASMLMGRAAMLYSS